MNVGPVEIISIIGPTASGKTIFSVELARALGGEVVSVDSRQVYRSMDIGTDKISPEIRREIPHHLIDVADPDETFSAADFAGKAASAVRAILERGKTPILAGGTPFYFKAFYTRILTEGLERWEQHRKEYEKIWDDGGARSLFGKLSALDPVYSSKIHPNDRFRIIRALSIIDKTGRNPTMLHDVGTNGNPPYIPLYIGLYPGRETLYRIIAERVRKQFAAGYPDEVKLLMSRGYSPRLPSMKGFGYREIAAFLEGKMSLQEAIEGDIRHTKAFARRQMTWFRRFSPCLWYYVSGCGIQDHVRNVIDLWKERHGGSRGILN